MHGNEFLNGIKSMQGWILHILVELCWTFMENVWNIGIFLKMGHSGMPVRIILPYENMHETQNHTCSSKKQSLVHIQFKFHEDQPIASKSASFWMALSVEIWPKTPKPHVVKVKQKISPTNAEMSMKWCGNVS